MFAKAKFAGIVLAILLFTLTVSARVFFTGSNPVLSSIVFPQDNLLVPGGDNISFYTAWQAFPWWGDIDEPENRPNNEYLFSGERNDGAQYKQWIDQFDNTVSVSRWLAENKKLRFDLTYQTRKMNAEANGEDEERGTQYSYLERHAIRELYLTTVYAFQNSTTPIGIKFGLGGVHSGMPYLEHKVLTGSGEGESNLLYWGWKDHSANDQRNFAVGVPFKTDLQIGASFPRLKLGTRIRVYTGNLGNYEWNDSTGEYDKESMAMHNYTFRLYGIYNWYKADKFRFNTTALTRFTMLDTIGLPSRDRNISGSVARSKVFVLQVNPNVNIYPWKYPMTYIDVAILCNYQHTRYDYLSSENGGYIYSGWWGRLEDVTDETYSYANEDFAEAALDIYASIPVFGMKNQFAALGVSALVWRKYRWLTKYFGHMDNNEFVITHTRENLDKEMWLNTVINLVYRHGKVMYRLDFGQPLIYSLTPRTMIYDAAGKLEGGRTKEKMWLAQAGYKVGFFVSTDLQNFMKYQPLARPESRPVIHGE